MEPRKWTAITLTTLSIGGVTTAELRDVRSSLHLPTDIPADVGAIGETAVARAVDIGAWVKFDPGTPIELRQRRHVRYNGGAITYEADVRRALPPGHDVSPSVER